MNSRRKDICKEKGITPYKMGKDLGIRMPMMYRYTNNQGHPKYDRMVKIANYLQMEVNEIWQT